MADKEKTASLLTELGVEDLYGFLGVQIDATDKEINRAYRKKALKYHPDKNQDDPNAAEMFQKLSKVLLVLTDPLARASYDRWQRAKRAARRRHEELGVKRKKLKEKLEQRESQQTAMSDVMSEREAAATMQKEIERLREETQRRIQEQTELLRQQMTRGVSPVEEDEDEMPTLKVTWKAKRSDASNGGYNQSLLEGLFSCYGPLHHVLVSGKKRGKALVSFHSSLDAQRAVDRERGMPACPLTVTWVCGQPKTTTHTTKTGEDVVEMEKGEDGESGAGVKRGEGEEEGGESGAGVRRGEGGESGAGVRRGEGGESGAGVRRGEGGESGAGVRRGEGGESGAGVKRGEGEEEEGGENMDYESIVLMKLRQAEERKRLIDNLTNTETTVDNVL